MFSYLKIYNLFAIFILNFQSYIQKEFNLRFRSINSTENFPIFWGWERESDDDTYSSIFSRFQRYKNNGLGGINYSAKHENFPRAIEIARRVGLKIFYWYGTLLADQNHKSDFYSNYPDDYVINRLGNNSHDTPLGPPHYKIMCPSSYNTKKYLLDKYNNISLLPLDGVNIDYIRFIEQATWDYQSQPFEDTCYCKRCLKNFTNLFPQIPIDNLTELSMNQDWITFRKNLITDLAQEIASVMTRNGKNASCDVYPGPAIAIWKVRQNWQEWTNIKILHPMEYQNVFGAPLDRIEGWTKEAITELNKNRNETYRMIPGIEVGGVNISDFNQTLHILSSNKAHGAAFFELRDLTDEHWAIARSYTPTFLKNYE